MYAMYQRNTMVADGVVGGTNPNSFLLRLMVQNARKYCTSDCKNSDVGGGDE